jgi:transposase
VPPQKRESRRTRTWTKQRRFLDPNHAPHGQDRFTSKIHAVVDALGNPLKFILTSGNRHDTTQAVELLEGWETTRVIADKGYDAQSVLDHVATMGAEAVIPPKSNRKEQRDFDKEFYKERHLAAQARQRSRPLAPQAIQAREVLLWDQEARKVLV